MTILSRLMNFFPLFHMTCIGYTFFSLCYHFSLGGILLFIAAIYLLPVLCMRVHQYFFPLDEYANDLRSTHYSAWWGTHQIQALFNAIPSLEAILRLIPGFYSFWLRIWGSKVGVNIYWTPRVEITDRSLMEIGNNVIFGHKVACYSHIVSQKQRRLLLYVKKISIGNNVFIGAGSRIGPGVRIDDGTVMPVLTDVSVNQHFGEESE